MHDNYFIIMKVIHLHLWGFKLEMYICVKEQYNTVCL